MITPQEIKNNVFIRNKNFDINNIDFKKIQIICDIQIPKLTGNALYLDLKNSISENDYTDTDNYINSYDLKFESNKIDTFYFAAYSDVIYIYLSNIDRVKNLNAVAKSSGLTGTQTITSINNSGISGTIEINSVANGYTWELSRTKDLNSVELTLYNHLVSYISNVYVSQNINSFAINIFNEGLSKSQAKNGENVNSEGLMNLSQEFAIWASSFKSIIISYLNTNAGSLPLYKKQNRKKSNKFLYGSLGESESESTTTTTIEKSSLQIFISFADKNQNTIELSRVPQGTVMLVIDGNVETDFSINLNIITLGYNLYENQKITVYYI